MVYIDVAIETEKISRTAPRCHMIDDIVDRKRSNFDRRRQLFGAKPKVTPPLTLIACLSFVAFLSNKANRGDDTTSVASDHKPDNGRIAAAPRGCSGVGADLSDVTNLMGPSQTSGAQQPRQGEWGGGKRIQNAASVPLRSNLRRLQMYQQLLCMYVSGQKGKLHFEYM